MHSKRKIIKIGLIVALGVAVLVLNIMFFKNIGDIGSLPPCH